MVDYSKSGPSTGRKGFPRHKEHNSKGTDKNPFSGRNDKSALLERMKKAADKGEQKDD